MTVPRGSNRASAQRAPGRRRPREPRPRQRVHRGPGRGQPGNHRVGFEEHPCVSSTADRRIHHHAGGHGLEEPGDAFGHDGVVEKAVAHGASLLGDRDCLSLACSPPASSCRRDFSPTGETEAGGVGAVHLRWPGDCRRATGRCAVRGADRSSGCSLRENWVGVRAVRRSGSAGLGEERISGTVDRFPAGGVPELDAGRRRR